MAAATAYQDETGSYVLLAPLQEAQVPGGYYANTPPPDPTGFIDPLEFAAGMV